MKKTFSRKFRLISEENRQEGLDGLELTGTETRVYPASAEDGGGYYFEVRRTNDGNLTAMSENIFETREACADYLGRWMYTGSIMHRD